MWNKLGPEGRRELVLNARRFDSWKNLSISIGDATKDKREQTTFELDSLTHHQLEDLYRGEDICATICDAPIEAAFRQGYEVHISPEEDKDRSISEAVMARLDEMGVNEKLEETAALGRAMGGAVALIGADDGRSAEEPLDLSRIRAFRWVNGLTPRDLVVSGYYSDLGSPKYGTPELYEVRQEKRDRDAVELFDRKAVVHESRLIRFEGQKVSARTMRKQKGWGDSVLLRPYKVVRDYNMGWSGVSLLLHDFAQAILRIKGLAEVLAEGDEEAVAKRSLAMNTSRSVANVLLLDSEEEFKRDVVSLAGIPEVLREQLVRLAMAARMPVVVLAGISPAGLNATGESDIRLWYDRVKAWQTKVGVPILNRIVQLIFLDPSGPTGGIEPDNWSVKFNPPWQMSDKETAELRNKQAQTDQIYITTGTLLPEEVAVARFGGDTYSMETKLDLEARREAEKMAEAEAEPPPEDPANNPAEEGNEAAA